MKNILKKLLKPFIALFCFVKSQCTFKGRINRKAHVYTAAKLLLASLIVVLLLVFGGYFAYALYETLSTVELILIGLPFVPLFVYLSVIILMLFWAGICLAVRRMHDFGFSGWWYLSYLILSTLLAVVAEEEAEADTGEVFAQLASFVYDFSFWVVIFFKKGIEATTSYGPDPLDQDEIDPVEEKAEIEPEVEESSEEEAK